MRSELIALDSEKRQTRAKLNACWHATSGAAGRSPGPAPDARPDHGRCRRRWPSGPAAQPADPGRAGARGGSPEEPRPHAAQPLPRPQVGVSPSQMGSRITTWGVMLEMNIPLQQESRRGQEREAEAMVAAARSRAEACRSNCWATSPSIWPGWRPRGAPRR
jgi:cobalt-zinc-cadmium efflux system outer membrane protein